MSNERPTDPSPRRGPSESQQIRAVSLDIETSRDALANARATLRHDDHHGRMMIEILARSLDHTELQVITLDRLKRVEDEQRAAREEHSKNRRRIEALELLVDGASVGGDDG